MLILFYCIFLWLLTQTNYSSQMSVDWQESIFPLLHCLHAHLEETNPLITPSEQPHHKPATRSFSSLSLISAQLAKPATISTPTQILDKLPSVIPVTTPLLDLTLETVSPDMLSLATSEGSSEAHEVYATLVHNVTQLREAGPTGWKKVNQYTQYGGTCTVYWVIFRVAIKNDHEAFLIITIIY